MTTHVDITFTGAQASGVPFMFIPVDVVPEALVGVLENLEPGESVTITRSADVFAGIPVPDETPF